MRLYYNVLLFLFFSFGLCSQEPVKVAFHQLKNANPYHQQKVIIRGFLYSGTDGRWILSPEPNLRSCCVGASQKVSQHIFLGDSFIGKEEKQPISVQGIFFIDPTYNADGTVKQLYRMEQAIIYE